MLVKLAELIESNLHNKEVVSHLLMAFYTAVNQVCSVDNNLLTFDEISLAKHKGKLYAVKAYKERTGLSLMDAKNNLERYFKDHNLKFFQP